MKNKLAFILLAGGLVLPSMVLWASAGDATTPATTTTPKVKKHHGHHHGKKSAAPVSTTNASAPATK